VLIRLPVHPFGITNDLPPTVSPLDRLDRKVTVMTDTPLAATAEIPTAGITIRRLGADDAAAVTRLAQRDTARAPSGELLGAELDGRLVAAISTTTGEAIADPFRRTAELVDVLRLRARQLNGRPERRPRLLSLLRPARAC
jgi:hypothetical protein